MKSKLIAIATIVTVAVTMAGPAFGATIEELQAQINALLAQLASLQAQLGTPTGTGACTDITFSRNLTIGSSGTDVKCLQSILNQSADTQVAASGVGSAGSETLYFGNLTKAAVSKFQAKNAISPTAGFVGSITRAKLNTMLGTTPITPITPITPTPGTSGLAISLAYDTPVTATIPSAVFNQPVLKVNLTAGASGNVTISKIAITRSGLSANTDIDLLKVFDGTIQKGSGATLNSVNQAVFAFTTPIIVSAGTTKTLTIKADVNDTATTGHSLIFSVAASTDITSDAISTSGTAVGNTISITSVTIGSVTISAGPSNPTSDFAPEVGDTGIRILQMTLQCGSTEDIEVRQVIAVKVGTINNTDISKVELYNDTDSISLGSVTTFDAEGRATFDLASPLVITKGNSKNLSVKVDIASGSGRTISAKVKDSGAYTVTAVGKTFGYGVGFASSSWLGTATSQEIATGTLTITKSAATAATGYVAPGGTSVPLVTYDIEARGEGVIITEFVNTVTLTTSGTHIFAYGDVTSCKLVDENGNIVAGPVDTTTATAPYISFTDTFVVPLGIHKYTVKCNLASAITGGTIKIGFDTANVGENALGNSPYYGITAKGASTNDTIYGNTGSVQGNAQTIRAAAMTIVTQTTPVATSIVPGQQNIHFANIQLGAVSSGENINVTEIGVTITVHNSASEADIQNLRIFDASISQSACTGTGRAWDTTLAMCRLAPIKQPVTGTPKSAFVLSTPLVITKAGSSTIKVYGDYKSGVGASTEHFHVLIAARSDIVAVGATTGTTLTDAMKGSGVVGAGQAMTYGATGTLTTVIDIGTPNSANIAVGEYGTTGITMAKIKVGGTNNTEDVDIDYVDLTRTTSGTGADADIANVYLYEGSTLLGTGVNNQGSSKYRFDLTNYVISAYASKVWTVKADFNGTLNGATSAYSDKFNLVAPYVSQSDVGDLVATGKASGLYIGALAAVTGSHDMYLYKSTPKMEVCTVANCGTASPSGALNTSTAVEILRFKITADTAGDVKFLNATDNGGTANKIRFTLTGKAADDDAGTDTAITVKNITDSVTLDSISTDVSDMIGASDWITCDFSTTSLQIAAGDSKIVSLEVNTTDVETPSSVGVAADNIKASIANEAGDVNWNDDSTANIANNTYFTWLPLTGNTLTVQ